MKKSLLWMVLMMFVLLGKSDFAFTQGVASQKSLAQAKKDLAELERKIVSIKKGEFEKTADFEVRKTQLKQKIGREMYNLLKPSYPATVKVNLGNYDADQEILSIAIVQIKENLFLKVSPSEAKYLKTNIAKIRASGNFWIEEDGSIFLADPLKLTVGGKVYEILSSTGVHLVRLPIYVDGNIASFSPDGSKFLAVAGREVSLWDLKTVSVMWRFPGQGRPIFSPDGKLIAVPRENIMGVINISSGEVIKSVQYRPFRRDLYTGAFSPENRFLALHDQYAHFLTIFDLHSNRQIKEVKSSGFGGISFSAAGSLIALGPVIYEIESFRPLSRFETVGLTFCGRTNFVAGNISNFNRNDVVLWNVGNREEMGRINSSLFVYRIDVTDDGQFLLAVKEGDAFFCSVEPFKVLRVIMGGSSGSLIKNGAANITLSPDGSLLAIGDRLYEVVHPGNKNELTENLGRRNE